MSKTTNKYTIGYKRPPLHSQFQKGQSGNPLGRPKKQQTVAEIMQNILQEEIMVNGKKKTKMELFLMSVVKHAIEGNATASKLLLSSIDEDAVLEDFTPELDDEIALMKLQRSIETQQRKEDTL